MNPSNNPTTPLAAGKAGGRPTRQNLLRERDAINERLTLGGGSVIDVWIIVREPNRVPEVKRPGAKGTETAEKMLREMIAHRNQETQFILVELTWNHELWVQDGREYLAMFDEGLEGPVDHFPHQPGPAAGDGARKAAEEILSWAFQNECDRLNGKAFMLADELTKYCAAIIARHCPSPGAGEGAGWNEAIEAAANFAHHIFF